MTTATEKPVNLYGEALQRCAELLERAKHCGLMEPMAMTLATVDARARPSARTVLLKKLDERGFVFYTNKNSRKGRELAGNPKAALCFFWQPLMEQIRVEGVVETVSDEEADAYWATRSRASQIGAWASDQSQPLDRRETLEARATEYGQKFAGVAVPRPMHWSGYRVVPDLIEFWRSRPGRLHERICYEKVEDSWTRILLNP
jgi:pyridoxamine-phosphate oxidase